jgi:hypothetical protein
MKTLRIAVLVSLLLFALGLESRAGFLTNKLGSAGPTDYSILGLDTNRSVQIGSSSTPQPVATPQIAAPQITTSSGTIGNVGVVNANAAFALFPGSQIAGNVLVSGPTSQFLNNGTVTGQVLGNQGTVLNAANTAARNAAAFFASQSPTFEIAQINSGQTITANNPGGLNVLNINNLSLTGQTLTLSGPAGTQFLINDSGSLSLNAGNIVLTGGLTPSDVVFNLGGPSPGSVNLSNGSLLNGIVVDSGGNISLTGSQVNGELIGGGSIALDPASLVMGAPVQAVPVPPSFLVMWVGGVFMAVAVRARRCRRG